MRGFVKSDDALPAHQSDPSPADQPFRVDQSLKYEQPHVLDTERGDDPDPILITNSDAIIARKKARIARKTLKKPIQDEYDNLEDDRSGRDSHNAAGLSVSAASSADEPTFRRWLDLAFSILAVVIIGVYLVGANQTGDSRPPSTSFPNDRVEHNQPVSDALALA